jgi:peptide/nickel transport system ATP-binding protein
LVSHDLAVVRYLTNATLVLYGGKIVESGPTAKIMEAPQHPYTKLLLASVPGNGHPPAARNAT